MNRSESGMFISVGPEKARKFVEHLKFSYAAAPEFLLPWRIDGNEDGEQ
jgi:hypothetical protein